VGIHKFAEFVDDRWLQLDIRIYEKVVSGTTCEEGDGPVMARSVAEIVWWPDITGTDFFDVCS
jgi:hypothetical protein